MQYSISDFLNLAFGFIFFWLGARKYSQLQREGEPNKKEKKMAINDFMMATFSMGFFQILVGGAPLLALFANVDVNKYLQWHTIAYSVGIVPLIMSTAFLLAITADFFFPKRRSLALALGMLASVAIIISLFITPATPTRVAGVTFSNPPPAVAKITAAFGGISVWIGAITFLYGAIKESFGKVSKTKSWLMGLGFLFIGIAGPLHLVLTDPLQYTLLDGMELIGVIFIGTAILVIKEKISFQNN